MSDLFDTDLHLFQYCFKFKNTCKNDVVSRLV